MRSGRFRRIAAVALSVALCSGGMLAQDAAPKPKDDKAAKTNFKPLDDKNDPTLIGKRDINKGNLAFYSVDREVALGRQLSAEVDRESPLINDPLVTEYVNRIAQNIVLHSDAKVPFTVKVIDSQDVNAFALPGGFLYVNRGLLEAAENEAEVAGVLAHEIAHVAARHGIEQASKGELLNYASIPLIFLGGWGGYLIRQAAGLAVPLTFLKFSRGAEKEADRLGAQYMWASGYDPNALITFFEKLQGNEKKKPGTLAKVFRTHPMTGDRITEVRDLIVRFPDRGEYQISTSEFDTVKSRLLAVGAASRARQREADDRRPTLKRRPQTSTGDESAGSSESPDRPTLRRREGEASGSSSSSGSASSGSSESDSGRPTLKRAPNSSSEPASQTKPPATPDEERPTLKRQSSSN